MLRFRVDNVHGKNALIVLLLAMGLAGGYSSAHNAPTRAKHRHPPVRWDMVVDAAIHPLESNDYPVTLTAQTDLPEMTLVVGPRIRSFVSLSNTKIGPLSRGQTATVVVNISADIDQQPVDMTGLVALTISNPRIPWRFPLPNPLLVKLRVTCPCFPPDPGAANDLTIEGVDSDGDGLRDDVQRWIALNYQDSEFEREALEQSANAFTGALAPDLSRTSAEAVSLSFNRALACLQLAFGTQGQAWYDASRAIEAEYFDTRARWSAYRRFNLLLAGESGASIPTEQQPAACAFDVAALPD